MDAIQKVLNWATWRPGQLAAGIIVVVQLWWLILAPPTGMHEQFLSIILFAIYIVFLLLSYRAKRGIFRVPAIVLAVLFLVLNILYDISYLPSIQTAARFNGATYLVTDNPEFLGWGIPYRQFVKWKNPLQYEVHDLGYHGTAYKFTYDAKNNVVNLVDSYFHDKLMYSDDGTFRSFQGNVQVGSDRYYASEECKIWEPYNCTTTVFTLFKCHSDNTSCVTLPVTYEGEDGYVTLQYNESTGNIDFYVESYSSSSNTSHDILIYSFGPESRCYVPGCSITNK